MTPGRGAKELNDPRPGSGSHWVGSDRNIGSYLQFARESNKIRTPVDSHLLAGPSILVALLFYVHMGIYILKWNIQPRLKKLTQK